ncbi:hypothetical protein KUCAC02_002984, partial [Chaenocephalus aceratus]
PDRGHGMTPGRACSEHYTLTLTPQADLAKCYVSLADFKTKAPLPITHGESAGLKFG